MVARRWWRRGFLVACNLLLLLAALPAVGRPKAGARANGGSIGDKRPSETRDVKRTHRRPENVTSHQASSPKSSSASSSNSSSSDDDDDDDSGAEVAGEVVGACCAGMIGAMADRSASDPSDVEYDEDYVAHDEDYGENYEVYQVQKTSTPRAPQTSTPSASPTATPLAPAERPPRFDVAAAREALQKAVDEVDAQCVTEQERFGRHRLTVSFLPSGAASAAIIEPPPGSERLEQCAQAIILRARVPRFDGEETTVVRSIEGDAPQPAQADGGT